MKTSSRIFIFALAVNLMFAAQVFGQQAAPSTPPKFLMISQERVKPGKSEAHAVFEAKWTQDLRKSTNKQVWGLGIVPIAGPTEVWFVTPGESIEGLQLVTSDPVYSAAFLKYSSQEAEFLSEARSILAVYRPDLSYQPAIDFANSKYIVIGVERVRKGHDDEYKEYQQLLTAAREKSGSKLNICIYQVISGAPDATYLYLIPSQGSRITEDLSITGDAEKRRLELIDRAIVSDNPVLFAISPRMTVPSESMIAANPERWNPKPVVAAATAPQKRSSVVPAAKAGPDKK